MKIEWDYTSYMQYMHMHTVLVDMHNVIISQNMGSTSALIQLDDVRRKTMVVTDHYIWSYKNELHW